jgi:hypothetical protein
MHAIIHHVSYAANSIPQVLLRGEVPDNMEDLTIGELAPADPIARFIKMGEHAVKLILGHHVKHHHPGSWNQSRSQTFKEPGNL